ncbi:myo-inositol 2-dehydrogenase [Galdieria sulphuraria]|uniref:Myo-inositol 2-dehydrogenase n=1 Tax=Galdieria sulphuraria TaxID=130081 RepID=M2W856_GALSU|nr:myo-inositol 2-dehydrogenase [Galdieria sulphuraria]EME32051.1 myo-inositol 2-dehydrogenase [Galdieria sulphuraria]|eukprot:XP_005708571.1 myo-inositol 2-dehydrogenase [Galdieria sulphuraria]
MHKALRLVVVGTGRMGKIHIYNAATSLKVKLVGVYDIPEKRKEASKLVAETGSKLYEDWHSQVLANTEVDAIVIASPTHTHKTLTLDALESGKSVLCEKPLGEDFIEIQMCHQKAKEKGLTLLIDWNRRLDPSFMKLVSEVRKGFIGQLQIIRVSGRDHPVPPLQFLRHSNSCIFRDMIVHDVDLVRWIMNSEPISVYATATSCLPELAGSGIYDTATALMEFKNGAVAMLDSARNACYGYDQRLEVFGDKGMLSVENFPSNGVTWCNENGIKKEPYVWSFPQRYQISFRNVLEHFADVVLRKHLPMCSEEDDFGIYKVVSAMSLSASLKRRVFLDEMNEKFLLQQNTNHKL